MINTLETVHPKGWKSHNEYHQFTYAVSISMCCIHDPAGLSASAS